MFEFDRLLVPVDFSRDSMAALGYALALARKLQGSQTLVVLYVVDESLPVALEASSTASLTATGRKQYEAEAKQVAEDQIRRFVEQVDVGEERIEIAVAFGKPASDQVCRYAGENDIDMIVVGSQGKGALKRLVLGSTVQRIQRYAPCPVLAVKDPATLADGE